MFGAEEGPIHLSNVQCYGNENSLSDCQYDGINSNTCFQYEAIGIKCILGDAMPGMCIVIYIISTIINTVVIFAKYYG